MEPANPFNPSATDVAPTYDNPAYDDAAPAPVTTFGAYDVGAYGSDAAPAPSSSPPPPSAAAAADAYQPSGGAYGGAGTALASAAAAYGSGSKSPRSDGGETSVRVRELEQREAALRRRRVLFHTGPHTTALALCSPILKDVLSRRSFLSARPSLVSIPTHRARRLSIPPLSL